MEDNPRYREAHRSFGHIRDSLFNSLKTYEDLGRVDPVANDLFAQGVKLLEDGDEDGIAELEEGLHRLWIVDRNKLANTIGDLLDAFRKEHPKLDRPFDVGIITALHDPELQAVLGLAPKEKWEDLRLVDDPQVYHKAEWVSGRKRLTVVAAAQSQIGVVSASILATKMILRWRPSYLVMTGITAGVPEAHYGDIVVAQKVFLHDSGKLTPNGILPDSRFIDIDQGLINKIESKKDIYTESIRKSFPGKYPDWALEVRMGTLGTVKYVVNDRSFMDEAKRIIEEIKANKDRKLVGIEMESYGIAKAAQETGGETKVLIIKSISDFGQDKTTDEHNKYAAYTSAQFFYRFAMDSLATVSPGAEVNS